MGVCVPVVALGAPLGAVIASYLDRRCFARFVYFANITQIIGAFNIIKPWNAEMGLLLTVTTFLLIVVAAAIWGLMVHLGTKMVDEFDQEEGAGIHDVNTKGVTEDGMDTVTITGG